MHMHLMHTHTHFLYLLSFYTLLMILLLLVCMKLSSSWCWFTVVHLQYLPSTPSPFPSELKMHGPTVTAIGLRDWTNLQHRNQGAAVAS